MDRPNSLSAFTTKVALGIVIQLLVEQASTRTDKVRVVCRGADAHRLGGASVQVAHAVSQAFQLMCRPVLVIGTEDFVEQYGVVRWTGGTFCGQSCMVSGIHWYERRGIDERRRLPCSEA